MQDKVIEFVAIPSGDYECFCFDVPLEAYKHFTSDAPEFSKSSFNEGLYRLYPSDILYLPDGNKPLKMKIEVKEENGKRIVTITSESSDP